MLVTNILLAEDSDDDLFLMRRALRQARIASRLHVVCDGQQAIDYLGGSAEFQDREQFPLPDLLFLDIKMPGHTGFEVAAWMRCRSESCWPLTVILSSSDLVCDRNRAIQLGIVSYAVKPPTPRLFDELAARHGISWPRHELILPPCHR